MFFTTDGGKIITQNKFLADQFLSVREFKWMFLRREKKFYINKLNNKNSRSSRIPNSTPSR